MLLGIVSVVVLVGISLQIHYEALRLISSGMRRLDFIPPRPRMLFAMAGIVVAHFVEITVFALGYTLLDRFEDFGDLAGEAARPGGFGEYLYFSAISYTSLGFGDVYPTGGLRLLAGVEALVGLLMIAWTASFTYLLMVQLWPLHGHRGRRR